MSKPSQKLSHGLVLDFNRALKLIRICRDDRKGRHSDRASLDVSFRRTVRVSDNGSTNNLPPNMGSFPIFNASSYRETLPPAMAAQGDYFLPMYQREAMWINFESEEPFAVKTYVGGVNAVSGEPSVETDKTKLRCHERSKNKESVQDYIVTPGQLWLDGIATADGKVRQFVAMPLGSGYSVEAQITGADLIGGLQMEVTPIKIEYSRILNQATSSVVIKKPAGTLHFPITVRTLTSRVHSLSVSKVHKIGEVKLMLQELEGVPTQEQRLIFQNKLLADDKTLADHGLEKDSKVHLVLRLVGGGSADHLEMGIAGGGLIKQSIIEDHHDPKIWDPENGTILNVQILNSDIFKSVTGQAPPETPVTAKTYAEHGLPYFDIFDEKPSGIKGEFAGVESVTEKDWQCVPSLAKAQAVVETIHDTQNPVLTLDQKGKHARSSSVEVVEEHPAKKFCKLST